MNKKSKAELIRLMIIGIVLIGIFFLFFVLADNGKKEYVELLIMTSDKISADGPIHDRADSAKQGYIVTVNPEGWAWGGLERDPKRFAIIKILKSEFNTSWLESEINPDHTACINKCNLINKDKTSEKYDDCNYDCTVTYNPIKTLRKYRLPVEDFLNETEYIKLKSIKFDEEVKWTIEKTITNISEKIVKVDWENRPEDWITHGSAGTFGIGPGAADYSSLYIWELSEQTSLTTSPCIANITVGYIENNNLEIAGWATTEAGYIKIMTAPAARHDGKWNESAFILNDSSTLASTPILKIGENYTRIEGLQIRNTATTYNAVGIGDAAVSITDLEISHTIISASNGIEFDGSASTATVWNSIMNGTKLGFLTEGIYLDHGTSINVYNTVVYNFYGGIKADEGIITINNSAIFNNTDDFNAVATINIGYCASDDGDGANNVTPSDWSNVFVDYKGGDFHLKSTDTDLKDSGQDLSSIFTDDIDGDTRTGTWDIGADEYIAGVEDNEYPKFSTYWDDNASLYGGGTGHFNVTIISTNGTVFLEINHTNMTATNLTSNMYNASYTFTHAGVYLYRWHSWGNGTSHNYNKSLDKSYTVNTSASTVINMSQGLDINSFQNRLGSMIKTIYQSPVINLFINRLTTLTKELYQTTNMDIFINKFIGIPKTLYQSFTINTYINRFEGIIQGIYQSFNIDTYITRISSLIQGIFQAFNIEDFLNRIFGRDRDISQVITITKVIDRIVSLNRDIFQLFNIDIITSRLSSFSITLNQVIYIMKGTRTYDFSGVFDSRAFNNTVAERPPTSLAPVGETEFTNYTNISTSDNKYVIGPSITGHPYHKFEMVIKESHVNHIDVLWEGHASSSETVYLYVWNYTYNNWSLLDSDSGATDFNLTARVGDLNNVRQNRGNITFLVQF